MAGDMLPMGSLPTAGVPLPATDAGVHRASRLGVPSGKVASILPMACILLLSADGSTLSAKTSPTAAGCREG